MAKMIPPTPDETGIPESDTPVSPEPAKAMTPWRKRARPAALQIPEHWARDPNCGEYLTTLDESDARQARQLSLAMAGKSLSGQGQINKRLTVVAITCVPFESAANQDGERHSKVGFHLHTAHGSVFIANYHARTDILTLVGRYGVPTAQRPWNVVVDPVSDANTYRVLAADLLDEGAK